MDFFNLLRSAEELLFEITMWIVLYPRTLWRSLRRPLQLAHKVNTELSQEGNRRFDDMVSPPICLLLSLAVGSALSADDVAVEDMNVLGQWIAESFYNELMFGAVMAASLPLMFSWLLLRRQQQPFNRDTVRRPFYLQAYLVSPMAAVGSPAATLAMQTEWAPLAWLAFGVALLTFAAYLANASRVAMKELDIGPWRAGWLTLKAVGMSLLIAMSMLLVQLDYAALFSQPT